MKPLQFRALMASVAILAVPSGALLALACWGGTIESQGRFEIAYLFYFFGSLAIFSLLATRFSLMCILSKISNLINGSENYGGRMRSGLRFGLATIMTWLALVALGLALIAQRRTAEDRKHALEVRLSQCLADHDAQEEMNRFLSDLGIDILKHCSGVELVRVSGKTERLPEGKGFVSVATPTGVVLEDGFALRAACVLLDHRNFGQSICDDPVGPQVGLRVKRGREMLDFFIGLDGFSSAESHQDVEIVIHDGSGKLVHYSWSMRLSDPTLRELTEALLAR